MNDKRKTDKRDLLKDNNHLRMLYRIAYLHLQGKKQYEIANILGLSKSKVNRLLKYIYDENIIEIKINIPHHNVFWLEQEILKLSSLREAIVVPGFTDDPEHILSAVGMVAANHLLKNLQDEKILAIGGGRTLYKVISNIETKNTYNAMIVPALGGIQGEHDTAVNYLAGDLARRIGASLNQLLVHAFCSSKEERDRLIEMPQIKSVLDKARIADIAILTIGSIDPETSSFYKFTKITHEELEKIITEENGAGELLAQIIDINGKPCAMQYADRVIGLNLRELKSIPTKIAVAALDYKAKPIVAALRGKFVDTLITDESTAIKVVEELKNNHGSK